MKGYVQAVLAVMLLTAASWASLNVTSPTDASMVGPSVHFVASASSSYPIAAMRIYVDDVDVYSTTSANIDTYLQLSTGGHNVAVQAWDSSGALFRQVETITVSPTNSSNGVTVTLPPNGAVVTSPVNVVATAMSSAGRITGMKVYLDDQLAFSTDGASVNTGFTVATGQHSMVVQAWDVTGVLFQQAQAITVAANGVTVTSPSSGAISTSPVSVSAVAASSGAQITAMKVYVDDQLTFSTDGASLNTNLPMPTGQHNVVVQAWDSNAGISRLARAITVAASGVTVTSPSNGAILTSPVNVAAVVASQAGAITAVKVYVDGQLTFSTAGASINTNLTMPAGQHNVVVQAWDVTGALFQQAQTITVAANGVTVTSPSNGAILTSPVNVAAMAASAGAQIIAMKVYVDGQLTFSTNGASLNTNLAMPTGQHNVVVQAWDSNGTISMQAQAITIAANGVTVMSPSNGAILTSPVSVAGMAASPAGAITAMKVYVDGQLTYSTDGASVNTSLPMSANQHNMTVSAWDRTGALFQQSQTFTVQATASANGVTIISPSDGGTVISPVHIRAMAASPAAPVTAMSIYVDNAMVFLTDGASLDTNVPVSVGPHNVVVQAWDSTGTVFKSPLSVNVGDIQTNIPVSATVIHNIEQMGEWESCTTCAGPGGNGPVASYSMTQGVSSPSMNGASVQFYLGGSVPHADALWWKQLGANSSATHFVYDLYFYLTNPSYAEGVEFDVNQSVNGYKYIFGVECAPLASGQWDVWDGTAQNWRPTGIPCPTPSANTWHHLTEEFARGSNGEATFVSITLDGVKHYVNQTYQSLPSSANEINVAFQMDGDHAQHAFNTWIDQVSLAYW